MHLLVCSQLLDNNNQPYLASLCLLAQIIADDVKCTHGCTVSDLEEEELFYLR